MLWHTSAACGILVPLPGTEPVFSVWDGRCWTTREVLRGFVKSRADSVDLQQSRRFCLSNRLSGRADAAPGGVGGCLSTWLEAWGHCQGEFYHWLPSMLLVPLLPGTPSLSLLNLSVSSPPSYTGHLLQLVCTPLKASGNVYTWRIFGIISSTLPRVPGALVVRAKISAQPSQSRKKILVTYCLIEMRNPKIFIEAMFVIIPNWNQSSCVLPLKKKKKRLGRFAYPDPKNLQNIFLSKKSKLRMIDTVLCHLF